MPAKSINTTPYWAASSSFPQFATLADNAEAGAEPGYPTADDHDVGSSSGTARRLRHIATRLEGSRSAQPSARTWDGQPKRHSPKRSETRIWQRRCRRFEHSRM